MGKHRLDGATAARRSSIIIEEERHALVLSE
jgi:hypothetical protein